MSSAGVDFGCAAFFDTGVGGVAQGARSVKHVIHQDDPFSADFANDVHNF